MEPIEIGIFTLLTFCIIGISYAIYQLIEFKKQLKEVDYNITRLDNKLNHEREVLENVFNYNINLSYTSLKKDFEDQIEKFKLESMQKYTPKKSDSDVKYY